MEGRKNDSPLAVMHNKTRGLIRLLMGILIILAFMFGLGPWMERIPMIRPMVELIRTQDIDAGAYYYTDIEEFSEAEFNVNHALKFPPASNY
jgi:hypothetical protein